MLKETYQIAVFNIANIPFLEYAGFMLLPCNLEDRKELQKCQNDALRLCARVKIADWIKIEDLHAQFKISSLEQRRRIQLLLLMYKKSKDRSLHKVFARNTRRSNRIVFNTDQYEGSLYKRSPYFQGCKLWDALPVCDIDVLDIFTFKQRIKKQNRMYVDLL